MKPLCEWATDDITSQLYNCVEEEQAADMSRYLIELLRRARVAERELCVAACHSVAAGDNVYTVGACVEAIRAASARGCLPVL